MYENKTFKKYLLEHTKIRTFIIEYLFNLSELRDTSDLIFFLLVYLIFRSIRWITVR